MDIYYRIFNTYYGTNEKSTVLYYDGTIRYRPSNYKIKGTLDQAYEEFKNHCALSRFDTKKQHFLLELGTDSGYNIVAIQNLLGEVIYLK